MDTVRKHKKKPSLSLSARKRRRERWIKVAMAERDCRIWEKRQFPVESYLELIRTLVEAGIPLSDIQSQLRFTTSVRKSLSQLLNTNNKLLSGPSYDLIISSVVPPFVHYLSSGDYNLQFEAAWALTNVSYGPSKYIQVVIDAGAIPKLIQLLDHNEDHIQETAAWALGNIAGGSPIFKDLVLLQDALKPLLTHFNTFSPRPFLRKIARTLCNLCHGHSRLSIEQKTLLFEKFRFILNINDEDILTDVCWAISYLCDGTNDRIQFVLRSGVCPLFIKLFQSHPSPTLLIPILRTFGNIVTGDELQTEVVIKFGLLPILKWVLTGNHKENIKREACWIISNINAGSQTQVQAVINAEIMHEVILLLSSDAGFDLKKEAVLAISNTTFVGNHAQIMELVTLGCIEPMCRFLTSFSIMNINLVAKSFTICCEGLENILVVAKKTAEDHLLPVNLVFRASGKLDHIKSFLSFDTTIINLSLNTSKIVEKVQKIMGLLGG